MTENDDIKNLIKRKREILRRKWLYKLLKDIEEGQLDSSSMPNELFSDQQPSPRRQYISPESRDTRRTDYMTIDQMMARSPNYK